MDAYFCCQRLQPIDLDLFSVMEVHGPLPTITNCKKKTSENWKFVMTYLVAKLDMMWREAIYSFYPLFINFTAEILMFWLQWH